ncbi:MAG: methylmalonyl Co-A mutase-associated GTPase MeaB [Ilyomonas sp.]
MLPHSIQKLTEGNIKVLSRTISLVENEAEGYEYLLENLPLKQTKITGITGQPGAGKSTITDALIAEKVKDDKRVAGLCVDPSSPFNLGAVLGDRIRMNEWYTHPNVFIRSMATRGSMGGLNAKIIEVTDVLKAAPFDDIIVETVGVGQSEIEIAGLADTTVVVLVPEAGDEVQTMKAGLMEIADIFVVNKADRPGADAFIKNLRQMLAPSFYKKEHSVPVIKTVASQRIGIKELSEKIETHQQLHLPNEKKIWLLTEKSYNLIQQKRMKDIDKKQIAKQIGELYNSHFNLYKFIRQFC